jgi:hypothetical protein
MSGVIHPWRRLRHRTIALTAGVAIAALPLGLLAPPTVHAATQPFPSYGSSANPNLNGALGGDIAGSAFVDNDGQFHWISSYAGYNSATDTSTTNSYTKTFTNTDMGTVSSGIGSTTAVANANTHYTLPDTLCYKVDQKLVNPAPSLYQDDHCDVIGIWVDPATGTWYGAVNDEFQFNPWGASTQTPAQRVATGIHYDRIMLASSTDKGANWNYGGAIVTSQFQHNGVADDVAFPSTTWEYGVAGVRLFVDQANGYFYLLYNSQVKTKPGYTTFAKWFSMARAPISGKMAPGTWNKYSAGGWSEPGLGGVDGQVGSSLGLNAAYNASTNVVSYTGTGGDGRALNIINNKVPSTGVFTFTTPAGASYTADAKAGTIKDSTGVGVASVSYSDPALKGSIVVQPTTTTGTTPRQQITITETNDAGDVRSQNVVENNTIWLNSATARLYVEENRLEESAITYDAFAQRYRAVGYNGYVFETSDLSKPNSWYPVGLQPAGTTPAYLSGIDNGSLSNQNVSGRTYRMISALNSTTPTITMTPHSSSQPVFTVNRTPLDATGAPTNYSTAYLFTLGGTTLSNGQAQTTSNQWKLVAVRDEGNSLYNSGFYRLQNVQDGSYLQIAGSTPQAVRAVGAASTTGAAQADFLATGNGGRGTPGGSDQWYLQPVTSAIPATLNGSSAPADVAAASNTSISSSTNYRLVSRNSGMALELTNGAFSLNGQTPGSAAQILTIRQP